MWYVYGRTIVWARIIDSHAQYDMSFVSNYNLYTHSNRLLVEKRYVHNHMESESVKMQPAKEKYYQDFPGYNNMIQYTQQKWWLPSHFSTHATGYRNFKVSLNTLLQNSSWILLRAS